ncbi:glucose-1-phosphate adenylyltransferase [Aliiglaciecola lipolytica]|uniref:Glucose-1-phosphate adenylyltransferase n=1 Tax=Aliiglaciecola lipolytica E3 TaxID=1127673 RepID=K6YNX1_9ALTE|nr:glucose-1-phosphate adenylyltransferase [Aliiglaciecola lipolytica]GAC13050.1 glucose-1-phosphate adenylyltransferase [Aliiglaciecola lipolytica E3]
MSFATHLNMSRIIDDTFVVLLAGGKGTRLHELTESRSKPALEFGCNHRIIDFPLSNCANSGLKRIGVVTQYKAQCLIRHLVNGWSNYHRGFNTFLEIMPASQQVNNDWYSGTADALYQNIDFLKSTQAKFILVLSGDHIYKMDYRTLLTKHVESGADMTVSCCEVPKHEAAGQFGVMNVDAEDKVISFEEKPSNPKVLKNSAGMVLASMGNYVFNIDFLVQQLERDAKSVVSKHDFGKDIIPKLIQQFHIQAQRFHSPDNVKTDYWKDVGTLDAYWQANMALLEQNPSAKVHDVNWPIWSSPSCNAPTHFRGGKLGGIANIKDTLLANGVTLNECTISRSLLSHNVTVEAGANLTGAVILPNVKVGKNVVLNHCIIDQNCEIPAGIKIGLNLHDDEHRGFRISQQGVVLVNQKMIDNLTRKQPKNSFHRPHREQLPKNSMQQTLSQSTLNYDVESTNENNSLSMF